MKLSKLEVPESAELILSYLPTSTYLRLIDLSYLEIAELELLAQAARQDITSAEVKGSNFYKAIQTTELLVISRNLQPETIVPLLKIAMTSPTIHTVNMIGGCGIEIASILAASDTIHTVNMIGGCGIEIASILAASDTIHTVGIHGKVCAEGYRINPEIVAIASILAASNAIHTVNMSGNYLNSYAIAVVRELAASGTIRTVDMSRNCIGQYSIGIATVLAESPTIHTIDMRHNQTGGYEKHFVASILAPHNDYVEAYRHELIHQVEMPVVLVDLIDSYTGCHIVDFILD